MAIEDILSRLPKVFGTTPEVYRGLLEAPEQAALENRANIGGLLGFAGALAQGMSPQGYRRSAAQNILTALGAGYGAAGQTYESGLNQISNVMKLAQAKRQISGLAAMRKAHPDLAYIADVSPDEFVRQVSARERAKMYGLTPTSVVPSPAPNVVPSAAPAVVEPCCFLARGRRDFRRTCPCPAVGAGDVCLRGRAWRCQHRRCRLACRARQFSPA